MSHSEKINIGLDMDGVIVDFMAPICRHFNISKKDCTTYKLENLFPKQAEAVIAYYTKKGYFKNLKPYPGALDFIKKLQKLKNVTVWYVSKPSRHNAYTWSDKIEWINEYTPDLLQTTILTQDKSIIAVDIFIDDDPDNLEFNCAEHKILFDQYWNKKDKTYSRVKNYIELYEKIKRIVG